MLQEEKPKLEFEQERIIIPSKYSCERHSWYSDVNSCQECYKEKCVKLSDLNGKSNLPIAAFIDDNKVLQFVINTDDEFFLWGTWKRLESAIAFVLQQKELRRQATSIQTAPASVLNTLRGDNA